MTDWVQPLREDLKSRLIRANTIAEGRVESEQADPTYSEVSQLAGKLPKLCVYTPEDELVSSANGTRWDAASSTIVIDCWAYGMATDGPPALTAVEAAANSRDRLAFQALRATIGDPSFIGDDGNLSRVKRATLRRGCKKLGEVTYGCTQIVFIAEQPVSLDAPEPETLFERFVGEVDVADAGGPDDDIEITVDVTVPQTGEDG